MPVSGQDAWLACVMLVSVAAFVGASCAIVICYRCVRIVAALRSDMILSDPPKRYYPDPRGVPGGKL